MNKSSLIFIALLSIAGSTFAQNEPVSSITESTDPTKIAEIEKRAEEIAMQQQQMSSSGATGAAGTDAASKEEMPSRPQKMHKDKKYRGTHKKSYDASGDTKSPAQ